MHISFPLFPSATRDSDSSFTDPQAIENGIELLQNGNGEQEPAENQEIATEAHDSELNGMDEDKPIENDDIDVSTEDLLKSLQAIEDENMKTFEELVGKLNELTPTTNLSPALLKKPYMTSSQDFSLEVCLLISLQTFYTVMLSWMKDLLPPHLLLFQDQLLLHLLLEKASLETWYSILTGWNLMCEGKLSPFFFVRSAPINFHALIIMSTWSF